MKNIIKIKYILVLLVITFSCVNSALAGQQAIASFGEVAGNIHGTVGIVVQAMWAACIIVGMILFGTAFSQYQTHKRNPKLVPLTVPITYLILGLISIAIPVAEKIFQFNSSDSEQSPVEQPRYIDID